MLGHPVQDKDNRTEQKPTNKQNAKYAIDFKWS